MNARWMMVVVLLGCGGERPAEPVAAEPIAAPPVAAPPVGTQPVAARPVARSGTQAAPIAVAPGQGVDVALAATPKPPATFALAERADIALVWSADDLAITGADGVTTTCERSPCVLPLAAPGAYRVEPRTADGRDASPAAVTARALVLPPAAALAPGGTVTLRPTAIAADDPRAAIADATFHVDALGLTRLTVRPLDNARTADLAAAIQRIGVDVYGSARAPMATTSLSRAVPGALDIAFDVAPGDYRIRAHGVAVEIRAAKLTASVNPIDATQLAVAHEGAPVLRAGATLALRTAAPPPPVSTWLDIPAGFDVGITWAPADAALGLERPKQQEERLCEASPCILAHASAGPLVLATEPADPAHAAAAHVRLLPEPAVVRGLAVGHDVHVATAPVVDGDPRRALAEVAVELPRAGSYQIVAKDLDWKTPPDWRSAPPRAQLDVLDYVPPGMGGFGESVDDVVGGISRAHVTVDAAARYVVRIDGDGKSPPRHLLVSVVAVAP